MKKLYLIIVGIALVFLIGIGTIIFVNNKKFLVTFDSNGGTSVKAIKLKKDELINQPSDPIKNGYVFIGWTENGKAFSFLTKITKNITLTAAWEEVKENVETYIIKFDSEGGSAILDQIVEKEKSAKKPEDPIKENFQFIGWTLNDMDYDFNSIVNSDITLKAKWEEIKKTENKKVSSDKKTQTTNTNKSNSTQTTNTDKNNSTQTTNTTNNTSVTLPIPELTETGRGGDPESFGYRYKITAIDNADGVEVYKSKTENNYLLETTLTQDKLTQINFEILVTANTGEHNYYKLRSYKMVDGVKKYSDYSRTVDVSY